VVAAAVGAAWGAFGYEALWENVPFAPSRGFVVSLHGTLVLLPVRIVLGAIHFVESQVVGHPFTFTDNTWWIGAVAAAVGSAILVIGLLAVRMVQCLARRARSGGHGPPR
jgi:hypothetical protein